MNPNQSLEPKSMKPPKTFKWQEFVAGAGAGALNVGITYPIQKTMFRQMRHGVRTTTAFTQLKTEGLPFLYRGSLPPVCMKVCGSSIMFGGYQTYGHLLMSTFPKVDEQFAKSTAAVLAGITEAFIVNPFERVQVLLQDSQYNTKLSNSFHAVKHIWRNNGLAEFYRGLSVVATRNAFANIVFFVLKEKAETSLPKQNNNYAKVVADFINGAAIGGALSTAYYPLNVIKTRMQCRVGGSWESPRRVLKILLSERGGKVSGMYRGVHLNYLRSFLSWGIINASVEVIKQFLYRNGSTDS